jgi:FdhD protein
MDDGVEKVPILRLTRESRSHIEDIVTREFPLTLILNNQELVTLLCSPMDFKYLAIGFLSSEGLLKSKREIKKIIVDTQRGVVRVETENSRELDRDVLFKRLITSGCGMGSSFYNATDATSQKVESQVEMPAHSAFTLINDFQHRSQLYRTTGGVHSAALCDMESVMIFREDIGRHNAIDKVFGECFLKAIPTDGMTIITSGRITSEILLKVAKRNVPIIISKSAPTDLGVKLANDLGVTLLGFARGKRINIYTNDWRIVRDGK